MKIRLFTFLLYVLLLASCSQTKPYPRSMRDAEKCMTATPGKALIMLSSLRNEIQSEPEETQMYYHLLTIQAQDKLLIPHKSDSLILNIVRFYENYGDNVKLMKAYHYLASTYRDLHDSPLALKYFQRVIDLATKAKQYTLLGQAYGEMSTLFAYQGFYDESLQAMKQSYHIFVLLKDSMRFDLLVRDMARIYNAKGERGSALWYYRKALTLSRIKGLPNDPDNILSEMGCLYYDMDKPDSAKAILLKLPFDSQEYSNAIFNLGCIYYDEGKLDSATYYYNKTLKYKNIYTKSYAYRNLSFIEYDLKNYKKALDYNYTYQEMQDSINKITHTETIKKMESVYNYKRTQQENELLKLQNQNNRIWIYLLISLCAIGISITYIIISRIQKKKEETLEQERKMRKLKEEQYSQSLERIEENKKRLKELDEHLQESEKQNDYLNRQLLLSQKETLELFNKQSVASQNERTLREQSLKNSSIYQFFHQASYNQSKIDGEHWAELATAINTCYPRFTEKLYFLNPRLTPNELRICSLVKISLSVKDISQILFLSKSAITKSRSRLYKKMNGTEGTGEDLDKFIIDL